MKRVLPSPNATPKTARFSLMNASRGMRFISTTPIRPQYIPPSFYQSPLDTTSNVYVEEEEQPPSKISRIDRPSAAPIPNYNTLLSDPIETLNEGWTDGIVDVYNLGRKVLEAKANPLCDDATLEEFISSKARTDIAQFKTLSPPDESMKTSEQVRCLHEGFNVALSILNEKVKKANKLSAEANRRAASSKPSSHGNPPMSQLHLTKDYVICSSNGDFKNMSLNEFFANYRFITSSTDVAIGKVLMHILKNATVNPSAIQNYTVRESGGKQHLKKLPDEVLTVIESFVLGLLGLDLPELRSDTLQSLEATGFYQKLSGDDQEKRRKIEVMKNSRIHFEDRIHTRLKEQFYCIREFNVEVSTNGVLWKNDKKKKIMPLL